MEEEKEPESQLPAAPDVEQAAPVVEGDAAANEPSSAAPKEAVKTLASEGTIGRRVGDRAFGVGRRKTAVARIIINPGSGRMTINGREPAEYFRRPKLLDDVNMPFVLTGTVGRFDVTAKVNGSSLAAQAGAVRLALARALAAWQSDFRPALAMGRLLTRDPRMVERKKYGIRGARRRPQWTKR